jgi:serine/threonine protein kinase
MIKLIDFGVSKSLSSKTAKSTTLAGSYFIMAPEIKLNVDHGLEADIYSLGVIYF